MKLLAAKEWNKVFYKDGQKHRIKARAELVHRDGNSNAYFSITGEVERRANNNRWVFESGGCVHEEIVAQFPQLQLLCDIHLSDENGVPLYAYANAAYWAGLTKWQRLDLPALAKHLRVTETTATEILKYIENCYGQFDEITTPESAWVTTFDDFGLFDQWLAEAETAIKMLNRLSQLEKAQ